MQSLALNAKKEVIFSLVRALSFDRPVRYEVYQDSINLNRETVRRSLQKLAKEGRIQGDGKGRFWV
jgi:predicted transcriptional regulator